MDKYIKALLEFLKLAPRYLIALVIVGALLLFSPESFLGRMGMTGFMQEHRGWVGLVTVLSLVLFLVDRTIAIYRGVERGRTRRAGEKRISRRLDDLTEREKQVLRYYINNKTKTNVLDMSCGVVEGLADAGIIARASYYSDVGTFFAYNMTEFAWAYLKERPHLLEGATTVVRTDKDW